MTSDDPSADPAAPSRAGRALPRALVVVLVLFLTGVWTRPDGAGWAFAYDVVLYNAVYAVAAAWSWRAAGTTGRAAAGRWLAMALVLNAAGNVVYTLVVAPQDAPAVPSLADVLFLAVYPLLYVALARLVRSRSPQFGARMWLDGLIGASGAAAVAIALLLAPALGGASGSAVEHATHLAFPVADVLLLALLVGVGGALGLRSDRGLLTLGAGLLLHLLGDVVYLNLEAADRYVEGGALDLTWLVGVALMARGVQPRHERSGARPHRAERTTAARDLVEWRVLAVPVSCGVASVGLLAAGWGDRLPVSVACCAVGCLVAVIVRTAVTFRELHRLREVGREARTDELTGLANRRALLECAHDVVTDATPDRPMALLLMDLDGFKGVNDRLGHSAGDELLRQIGARMQGVLRPTDTLARLGGDEFAVVLPDAGEDAARGVAARLREALLDPFTVDGVRLRSAVSVGIATGPVAAPTVDALLRRADAAMYVAKDLDAGVHVHADGAVGDPDRHPTGDDLHAALVHGDLGVHLRPQMSLVDGRTVAVEALARWEHPVHGMLEPDSLRPLAERAGLQGRLAETVLDLALASAAQWWSHRAPLPVAVPLASASLGDVDLPAKIGAALARHGLPPRSLRLVVVEDVLARTSDAGRDVVSELRTLGVAVSVDRYGTGGSSLAALRHLPVDELRLDPVLVADVVTDARAASVVRHTAALAHALDLRVVADGVDDTAVLGALERLGCDAVEGAVVAAAMPVEALLRWLHDRPADRTLTVRGVLPTCRSLAALAG